MLHNHLPYCIFRRLFGDRRQHGLRVQPNDEDYKQWLERWVDFYTTNQKRGVGVWVNHLGFKVSRFVDYTGKAVLEVGPGIIDHLRYNPTRPGEYIIVDTAREFLELSRKRLKECEIEKILPVQVRGIALPVKSGSIDYVLSFHQIEHIYQLKEYADEIKRVLKPGGFLVGAVPCEGGVAWGLGRYLTSRRYAKKHMDFDYDKIICWEHPNFVNKIKNVLDDVFAPVASLKAPFGMLPFDFNLSWSFIYQKKAV